MVRLPQQLSKHQAASKEESSFSLTPSASDIVWRQGPPLPPQPSLVQSLEKGSNNDETCNESWTLRRLKQDMEEMRVENARMAHLVNVLRLSLRKQVKISQSTEMRAMDSERELRMLRMNDSRVEVETPCKMGNLLDPTLENPPANLEDTSDVSRQGNGDMLMTIEGREWVGTTSTHTRLKERLIAKKESSFSKEKNESPNVGLMRHKPGVVIPSIVPTKGDEFDSVTTKVKETILDGTMSQTQRSSEGGTVPSVAIETESRRHVKKSKDYKKKFEAATCKLEEKHVTKEEDLPMWLRERLEGGGEHGYSSDIDQNNNGILRKKEVQRIRTTNGKGVPVLPATKEEPKGDFGDKSSNDLGALRKMGMEHPEEANQRVTPFKSSYPSSMNEERRDVERTTTSPPSPSLNNNQGVSLREVTTLFTNLQVIEEKLHRRLIEGKKTHNGRPNPMTSRSRSGTTTEKGARVFSKSSDDKENMTEIRKTEGGKQNKQELSRDEINGHENEEKKGQVSRRASLRKARVLSYKEPSIMSKLRRHTGHSPGTIFPRASD